MECYDPTIDTWTLVSEMQTSREGAGLTNLDGVLYCVGGYDGNRILNSIERLDPRTGRWTSLAPMSTRRSGMNTRVTSISIKQFLALQRIPIFLTRSLSSTSLYDETLLMWRSTNAGRKFPFAN